jgi:putative membrane protein
MANRRRRRGNAWLGALAGAAAGLVASWVMVRFNHLIGPNTSVSDKANDRYASRREGARPNDTDGTIPDEPGSMQAASAIAEPVLGRELTEREKDIGGPVMHYVFGATVGALYGAAAEFDRLPTRGAGLPYGTSVWLIADEIGMHAAGFATRPADYPLSRHVATLSTHLVFGVTVEAVRRMLRGMPAQ